MKLFRKFIKISAVLAASAAVILIAAGEVLIWYYSGPYVFDDIEKVPACRAGLLLGTSMYRSDGSRNPFFFSRTDAAVRLYKAGKISCIIASGDNRTVKYNEPVRMKEELMKKGIPADRIYPDFAGFRTLDSVVRCGKIFGQNRFIIISQKFHNERAVFIALKKGLEPLAFNADDVPVTDSFFTFIREIFARGKAVLDVYFFDTEPKFYGEAIQIE